MRRVHGFTLIEVLIVIAIVGIPISVAAEALVQQGYCFSNLNC